MPTRARVPLRPLFVLLTALALGIVAASLLSFPIPGMALLVGMAAFLLASQTIARQHRAGNTVCLLITFFLFGMVRTEQVTEIPRNDISRLAGLPSLWVAGTVASAVESRPSSFGSGNSYSFTLKVRGVNDYHQDLIASGWLRVTVFSEMSPPKPGDILRVRGKLESPQPATNPDGFDYQAHLKRQGIYATLAARRAGDVQRIGHAPLPPLMQTATLVRRGVEQRAQSHLAPEDAALLLGMLLSQRSQLSADLIDAFTRIGAVHILSVSGMHIAVIAALLLWLLRTLTVPKKAAHALCITAVWLFALAAGGGSANPPAFRAALCATVFFAAPLLRRTAEPRHSLAFAALVLLVLDPLTLFDPGAQLSFATVGTILLWNPLLERLFFPWEPDQTYSARISRGIIASIAVGVVAHAGAWPLAAFYFHQFSVVSPLANLPVSVLADALVVGGLLLSAVPFLPWEPIAQGLALLRELALIFAAPPWTAFSIAALPVPIILAYYVLVGGLASLVRPCVLAPRKLFTSSASIPTDTGVSGGSGCVSASGAAVDTAGRTGEAAPEDHVSGCRTG